MKLLRYGAKGKERPGLVDADGRIRDLSGLVPDISADLLAPDKLAWLQHIDVAGVPLVPEAGRIAPPCDGIGKFICVGLNYVDHALEAGLPAPEEPILFLKATS